MLEAVLGVWFLLAGNAATVTCLNACTVAVGDAEDYAVEAVTETGRNHHDRNPTTGRVVVMGAGETREFGPATFAWVEGDVRIEVGGAEIEPVGHVGETALQLMGAASLLDFVVAKCGDSVGGARLGCVHVLLRDWRPASSPPCLKRCAPRRTAFSETPVSLCEHVGTASFAGLWRRSFARL